MTLVYLTYPVMLPVMSITFIGSFISLFKYVSSFHKIIDEIWLDRSGTEVRIVYRNRGYKKFRRNNSEEVIISSSLVSPVVEEEYKKSTI